MTAPAKHQWVTVALIALVALGGWVFAAIKMTWYVSEVFGLDWRVAMLFPVLIEGFLLVLGKLVYDEAERGYSAAGLRTLMYLVTAAACWFQYLATSLEVSKHAAVLGEQTPQGLELVGLAVAAPLVSVTAFDLATRQMRRLVIRARTGAQPHRVRLPRLYVTRLMLQPATAAGEWRTAVLAATDPGAIAAARRAELPVKPETRRLTVAAQKPRPKQVRAATNGAGLRTEQGREAFRRLLMAHAQNPARRYDGSLVAQVAQAEGRSTRHVRRWLTEPGYADLREAALAGGY